jgi:hypothetical protein
MRARSKNLARKPALSTLAPTFFTVGFAEVDVFVREGAIVLDLWRRLKAVSETREDTTGTSLLELGAIRTFMLVL